MIHPYSHIHIYLQNIDFNISLLGDFYAMEIAGAVFVFFPNGCMELKILEIFWSKNYGSMTFTSID